MIILASHLVGHHGVSQGSGEVLVLAIIAAIIWVLAGGKKSGGR